MNDPIPDTVFDPATLSVISPPASGPSVLLDKITIEKPQLGDRLEAELSAPHEVSPGDQFEFTLAISNNAGFALNGAQAVITLPEGVKFIGATGGSATVNGPDVVVTIGRLADGAAQAIKVTVQAPISETKHLIARARVRSATALPVDAGATHTNISN